MYVESEVGRRNDLSLFDILDEKVLVLDQQSKEVVWQNKADEPKAGLTQGLGANLNVSQAS